MPKKISQLTAQSDALNLSNDLLVVVDASDTTQGASGTTKKATLGQVRTTFASGINIVNGTFLSSGSRINLPANGNVHLSSSASISWSNGSTWEGADIFIARDAANSLALRNSTNAQSFAIYNTYTDGSNYERLREYYDSNVAIIDSQAAGTGAVRNLQLRRGGVTYVNMGSSSIQVHIRLTPSSSNALDLGASGVEWRNFYLAGAALLSETTNPTPTADKAILYAKDNGAGKTQLMVQFGTGDPIELAIEA